MNMPSTQPPDHRVIQADSVRWHSLSPGEALLQLGGNPERGLDSSEAERRLIAQGPNRPSVPPGRGVLMRLWDQVRQPLVLVLIGAGAITGFLGEWVDSGVIFGVVVVNAMIGFIQEGKATEALAALARAVATEVTVLRDGQRGRMDAVGLVPGDVVWLAAGDKVPADLRLLSGKQLRTVEAALTGEATPSDKQFAALPGETLLADRSNMAYTGTSVVAGQALGVVVATGNATETGRISQLIAAAPDLETPLTRKMAEFANRLLWAILGLAVLTMGVGWLRGESLFNMFMAAVALAVGAIPEGLPAAMTITLAIGVGRMAKRRAIIRHLPAVETLGSTTVICSDNTGTLTANSMTVRTLWAGGEAFELTGHGYVPEGELRRDGEKVSAGGTVREVLLAGILCNDATLKNTKDQWRITGDPTEAALLVAARKAGLSEAIANTQFPRRDELPFDAARQTMATLHATQGEHLLYAKGALERLLPACSNLLGADGEVVPLDTLMRQMIDTTANEWAQQGLRVLGLCRRAVSADFLQASDIDAGLTFLGLAGMIDPPRPHAIAAVKTCHTAGIKVKMITGDHAETALAIARQLNIVNDRGRAVNGRELAALDDAELAAMVRDVDVFARVEPEQKLRLVLALQANGEVVAMTGDGVNDAPALKTADIGIAMGMGGTDVAKEAAAMVLTDDNFATIEAAVEEGRGIYDNLVKFITWTLPTNFGEGLVILAAILAGVTLPITPLQILWINMTTAVLLGLPLAFEPSEHGIMHRMPRSPDAPMLDKVVVGRILLVGAMMLAGSFGLFMLAVQDGRSMSEARTIAANVFVAIEMVYLFNCRSLTRPLTSLPPFSNPWVWWGTGLMALLQIGFTYWAPLNLAFGTSPIDGYAWLQIAAVASLALVVVEIEKRLRSGSLAAQTR
jgi:magnesium-transporting ATPase (P-type)